jgi:hypothetical protein
MVPTVTATATTNAPRRGLEVVARDGYPQHSTLLSIPFADAFLDPRLDVRLGSRA